ncbi:hypothetical protein QTH91_00400 [Variovorax dokdonensis]|uniref:Uncharacterized protein n=1 Tax=Variovorax dokdonensis TaxID=344883 RepID=A0ABT7N4R1_9BURK|nr:hypothetical protein [Variovorax dokdonensis]MDM0042928.1 hypothetical protein [Variovorax dokdonensis]
MELTAHLAARGAPPGASGAAATAAADKPGLLDGLIARRTELADEVNRAEAQLRRHYEMLRNLDQLIRFEDPEIKLPPVRGGLAVAAKSKIASTLVRGDVSQLALDALYEAAGQVLTSRQVTDYIMNRRDLTFASKHDQHNFASSVTMALTRHARRGLIEQVETGSPRERHWRCLPAS